MYQKSYAPARSRNKGDFRSPRKFNVAAVGKNRRQGFANSNGSFIFFDNSEKGRLETPKKTRSSRSWSSKSSRNNFKKFTDYSRYISAGQTSTKTDVYRPEHVFGDFDLAGPLKENIAQKGYKLPTAIQDQAILPALSGRDIIGIAETGTGKTAAFLIPLINKVLRNPRERVLIVTPTRELASQIETELQTFSTKTGLRSVQVIGGSSMGRQIAILSREPSFIIGTPGRLNDLINRQKLHPNKITNIVLDEVDRMVDMGFIDDIKKILSALPAERQSLFFSATISPRINALIRTFLKDPITISVKKTTTPDNIKQDIIKVGKNEVKIEVLHELLIKEEFEKVLIFGKTKREVDGLSRELAGRGFRAASIHGDKPQSKREKALRQFKQDDLNILVATDVAARGLDIKNVTHVINYDIPQNYEDYVHRIGRTGRANKSGVALTFVP